MSVTITISETKPGRIECKLSGIDKELPEEAQIGGPEFMALPVPQRFGLILNEMMKQTDLGKMVMERCLTPNCASITIGGDDDGLEGLDGSKYPCRCRITDPEGEKVWENDTHEAIALQNPTKAVPKLGRTGWANLEPDGVNVRIKLDDGSQLMGYECWWEPISDTN